MNNKLHLGIEDEEFIRGKVPMTKSEVRAVTISKLRLSKDSTILDVGAGSGSISIEAALNASLGKVYAIERNDEGIELIKENMKKFGAENIELIHGLAPDDLPTEIKFDAIIIGGTGGNMELVLKYASEHLKNGGRLVLNLITIENMYKALQYIKENDFKDKELVQMSVSKGRFIKDITMMESNNPIYIISATKQEGEKCQESLLE